MTALPPFDWFSLGLGFFLGVLFAALLLAALLHLHP